MVVYTCNPSPTEGGAGDLHVFEASLVLYNMFQVSQGYRVRAFHKTAVLNYGTWTAPKENILV